MGECMGDDGGKHQAALLAPARPDQQLELLLDEALLPAVLAQGLRATIGGPRRRLAGPNMLCVCCADHVRQ